jgi:hypothetical protein
VCVRRGSGTQALAACPISANKACVVVASESSDERIARGAARGPASGDRRAQAGERAQQREHVLAHVLGAGWYGCAGQRAAGRTCATPGSMFSSVS